MKIRKFEFNPIQVNTYVVYDETGEAVIIDCGCLEKKEEKELSDFIFSNNLTVKHLLNTHLHLDHAFGNAFASKTYGLRPEGNKLEEEGMPGLKEQARKFGFNLVEEAVTLGTYLEEGDIISFGNNTLHCLFVPGHSPGSLCFYSKEGDCVFVGDVLFYGSIGRTDLWGGDFNTLISGIRSKLLILPDSTVVYPGHGLPTTIGKERKSNPYL